MRHLAVPQVMESAVTISNLVETKSIPLSLGDAADCCLGAGVRHQDQPGDAPQPSNFYDHCWSELFCSAGGLFFVLVDEFMNKRLEKKI